MEKVMLVSVECCEDAMFVTDMCSSVYLVSQCWEFFLSVAQRYQKYGWIIWILFPHMWQCRSAFILRHGKELLLLLQSFVQCCIAGSGGDRKGAQVDFSKNFRSFTQQWQHKAHSSNQTEPPAWWCLVQSAIIEAENLNWQVQVNMCLFDLNGLERKGQPHCSTLLLVQ